MAPVSIRTPARSAWVRRSAPRRNWRSGRGIGVAGGEGFGELAAGGGRSSSSTTAAPASAAAIAADSPAMPPPTTRTSQVAVFGRLAGRVGGEFGGEAAGDNHAVRGLGEAGALADAAVDRDDAVEARAHAAKQAPRCAGWGVAERRDAGGRERGGDGFAVERIDWFVVEVEGERCGGWVDGTVGQAHRASMPDGPGVAKV